MTGIPKNLKDRQFDRLIVIERVGSDQQRRALWRCKCSCGNEAIVPTSYLTRGNTRSCGCLQKEKAKEAGAKRSERIKRERKVNKIAFIRATLRKSFRRWPAYSECIKAAKTGYNQYTCAGYNINAHTVGHKEINVDHIIPMGAFESWDIFTDRLFCDASGLQILCIECHKKKTEDERIARKERKRNGTTDE